MVVVVLIGKGKGQLVQNFYASTCPMAEAVVKQAVATKFSQTFTTIPATLRLFFHDCLVEVTSVLQVFDFFVPMKLVCNSIYSWAGM